MMLSRTMAESSELNCSTMLLALIIEQFNRANRSVKVAYSNDAGAFIVLVNIIAYHIESFCDRHKHLLIVA